jgi:hypothetical protein
VGLPAAGGRAASHGGGGTIPWTMFEHLRPDSGSEPTRGDRCGASGFWWTVATFAAGVAIFLAMGGAAVIAPTSDAWVSGDSAWHQLGWRYFRREPWGWPLGAIRAYPDPVGTTIGLVDGVPWVALVAKLAAPRLPEDAQYLGAWLALSFGLQALFGARIVALYSPHPVTRLLGGVLFAISPPFLARTGHIALSAHWLVLWALKLALAREASPRQGAVVLLFAAGVHPYLLAMTALLTLPRLIGAPRVMGVTIGLLVAELWAFGYLAEVTYAVDGWGRYSADVLSLFDPMGQSRVVPPFASLRGHTEGFAWLGLGVLLAAPMVMVGAMLVGRRTSPWPILAVSVGAAVFALSDRIVVAGSLAYEGDFDYFGFGGVFQSSGRFVWPLHYLCLSSVLGGAGWLLRAHPRASALAFAAVLVIQIADRPSWTYTPGQPIQVPDAPEWELVRGVYGHLALSPPALSCCPEVETVDPVALGFLASRLGMTINSARVARGRCEDEAAYCASLDAATRSGRLDPDTVYVVARSHRDVFAEATCGLLDGAWICVAKGSPNRFAEALARRSRGP